MLGSCSPPFEGSNSERSAGEAPIVGGVRNIEDPKIEAKVLERLSRSWGWVDSLPEGTTDFPSKNAGSCVGYFDAQSRLITTESCTAACEPQGIWVWKARGSSSRVDCMGTETLTLDSGLVFKRFQLGEITQESFNVLPLSSSLRASQWDSVQSLQLDQLIAKESVLSALCGVFGPLPDSVFGTHTCAVNAASQSALFYSVKENSWIGVSPAREAVSNPKVKLSDINSSLVLSADLLPLSN